MSGDFGATTCFVVMNNQVIVERGTRKTRDFYIAWSEFRLDHGANWVSLDSTIYSGGRCVGYSGLRSLPANSRVWKDDNWITVEDFFSRLG